MISQIYGGGGNTSATYQNDYVELYNRSAGAVNITGWSLQYSSATGTFGNVSLITNLCGTIEAGQYYLIGLAMEERRERRCRRPTSPGRSTSAPRPASSRSSAACHH